MTSFAAKFRSRRQGRRCGHCGGTLRGAVKLLWPCVLTQTDRHLLHHPPYTGSLAITPLAPLVSLSSHHSCLKRTAKGFRIHVSQMYANLKPYRTTNI